MELEMSSLQGLLGMVVILAVAWALSEGRRSVSWRLVFAGVGLQLVIALVLLKVPLSARAFLQLNRLVESLEESTQAGTSFVFGYLGGGPAPFEITAEAATYVFAFRALPMVLVLSALASLFFFWGILPLVVRSFSYLLRKSLGVGGAEGLGVAANVFLGMVESPLFIGPYLARLTRSELFTVMTCGMATIAGTVMVLYASILADVVPNVLGHILTASMINAPAAVVVSKLLIPQTGEPTSGELVSPEPVLNTMDAVTRGTIRGAQILINIIAMLVVLVALVHLVNLGLGLLPDVGGEALTLQLILGLLLAPFVWLLGIPWTDAPVAGQLLGTKTILNELVAYLEMSRLPDDALSPKSYLILTYALCGFANPGSVGIMIGGLSTIIPERRTEIVALGVRSLIAGTLATCLSGALVGVIG
jgi:concentrative nucleoside transporter, CNT family